MQPSCCSMQSASRGTGEALPAGWLFLVPAERLQAPAAARSSRASASLGAIGRRRRIPRAEYRPANARQEPRMGKNPPRVLQGSSKRRSVRGRFIVLEGIDGSGTTTQLDRAVAYLGTHGHRAVATREPSAGPVGRLLRDALLGRLHTPDGARMDGRTMALLFAADRIDHLQREIEPQLAAGTTVVSDRYLLSSLAYQAEEADRAWVAGLSRGIRAPDLT